MLAFGEVHDSNVSNIFWKRNREGKKQMENQVWQQNIEMDNFPLLSKKKKELKKSKKCFTRMFCILWYAK